MQTLSVEKIILDTNFLLCQFECGLDIKSELLRILDGPGTLVICSGTKGELGSLAGKNGKRASAARFALHHLPSLSPAFRLVFPDSSGPVDEWIIKYAQKNKATVATNDVPLRRQLLALGVPVIAMKGKSKLGYV